MLWVYGAWIVFELLLVGIGKKKIRAFAAFAVSWRKRR
jgi:hypothetical protein